MFEIVAVALSGKIQLSEAVSHIFKTRPAGPLHFAVVKYPWSKQSDIQIHDFVC